MTTPDLSLIVPCYNEEESCGLTIRRLLDAFEAAGHTLEIVAVDNGSHDRTGEILADIARERPLVRPHRVHVNQGYGFGIISGIPLATGHWVGMIPADGQVDAEDVVRLYESAAETRGDVVAKVRRRFRMDGPRRKLVSIGYNLLIRLLWPRLDSLDVNGSPKLMTRSSLLAMQLESHGWFLDPELMLKAHAMKLRVLELNVFARMRGNGTSHVRASTCWEFLRSMLVFRFGRPLRDWKRRMGQEGTPILTGRAGVLPGTKRRMLDTAAVVEMGSAERGDG